MGISERRIREKKKREGDIVHAAEKVFFNKGFYEATMDDIAEEAELSKGTLYLYFKSKEDMKYAVFLRAADKLMKMMEKNISEWQKGLDKLIAMGETFIDFSRKYPDYFSIMIYFQSSDIENMNINRKNIEKYILEKSPLVLVHDAVKKGIEDGTLRNDIDALTFSNTLWSQMLGLLITVYQKKEILKIFKIDVDTILSTHFELLINGSKPKK